MRTRSFHIRVMLLVLVGTLTGCFSLSDRQIGYSSFSTKAADEIQMAIIASNYKVKGVGPLYRVAYETAAKRCKEYKVVHDKYYEGTEATSKFAGIHEEWIDLRIRCTTAVPTQQGISAKVQKEADSISQADFFDIHAEVFNVSHDRLFAAVERRLERQGDRIFRADRVSGLIVTGRARHGVVGFPLYEQYVVGVEGIGEGRSRLAFKLLCHSPQFGGTPGTPVELLPVERSFVYKRAAAFVAGVASDLGR